MEFACSSLSVWSQAAFDSDAEVAVAHAAKAKKALQVLSTGASKSIEDVIAAQRCSGVVPTLSS